ncbi:hypothetical protein MKX01_027006 [Papaver californicum]|nr:hypothetical protein MKX01_027006 [Papaver californicum]
MANLLPLYLNHLPHNNNFKPFSITTEAISPNGNGGFLSNNNTSDPKTKSSGGGRTGPIIIEIPLNNIRRPLMRTRSNDSKKVQELMDSIQQIGLQVPIDVLEVDGVYYGFSGCHRYEAHQLLGLPTIRCKVRRGTKETLRHRLR